MKKIQILKDLTSNILETMFFLIQETPPEEKENVFKCAVQIKNPKVDIIIMYCEKTARQMAENFLGTDEFDEQDIQDTLKESINIIAGNFIGAELADITKRVHIPTLIENTDSIDVPKFDKAVLYYNEEPVQILLKIE
jgi:chemotaxis protein CheY-P-specific phosphatase CheC